MCPYIVDWSMRDEMSGMPKKQQLFWCKRSIPVCLTFICQGSWHFNAILTNLDPFHTIEQKRHPILMAIDLPKWLIYDKRASIHIAREFALNPQISTLKFFFMLKCVTSLNRYTPLRAFMYSSFLITFQTTIPSSMLSYKILWKVWDLIQYIGIYYSNDHICIKLL